MSKTWRVLFVVSDATPMASTSFCYESSDFELRHQSAIAESMDICTELVESWTTVIERSSTAFGTKKDIEVTVTCLAETEKTSRHVVPKQLEQFQEIVRVWKNEVKEVLVNFDPITKLLTEAPTPYDMLVLFVDGSVIQAETLRPLLSCLVKHIQVVFWATGVDSTIDGFETLELLKNTTNSVNAERYQTLGLDPIELFASWTCEDRNYLISALSRPLTEFLPAVTELSVGSMGTYVQVVSESDMEPVKWVGAIEIIGFKQLTDTQRYHAIQSTDHPRFMISPGPTGKHFDSPLLSLLAQSLASADGLVESIAVCQIVSAEDYRVWERQAAEAVSMNCEPEMDKPADFDENENLFHACMRDDYKKSEAGLDGMAIGQPQIGIIWAQALPPEGRQKISHNVLLLSICDLSYVEVLKNFEVVPSAHSAMGCSSYASHSTFHRTVRSAITREKTGNLDKHFEQYILFQHAIGDGSYRQTTVDFIHQLLKSVADKKAASGDGKKYEKVESVLNKYLRKLF